MHGRPFAASSLLNGLRRQAVEQLAKLQCAPRPAVIHDPLATLERALARTTPAIAPLEVPRPQLHLLVRTPAQLEAALALRPSSPFPVLRAYL